MEQQPRLTIGLPVYNGENYLREALASIREQTFTDWELILSDNHSEDGTESICREAADGDERIKYFRHPRNLGAHKNYNFTLQEARGEYFKWAAHDDIIHPEFLRRAVEVLDSQPEVVVFSTQVVDIDENGNQIRVRTMDGDYYAASPYRRFRQHFGERVRGEQIFGVTRTEVLRSTGSLRDAPGSDVCLVSELLLHGKLHYEPEPWFMNRDHPDRYMRSDSKDEVQRAAWFSPANPTLTLKTWDRFGWYLSAVFNAPIPWSEKVKCLAFLARWIVFKLPLLFGEMAERRRAKAERRG